MEAAGLLVYVASSLLVVSGASKALDPSATTASLATVGLPSSSAAVRILAVWEIAVGLSVLMVGGRIPAGLVTLTYAAFAAYVVALLAGPYRSAGCGCFGEATAPPTAWHLGVDVVALVIGGTAAVASTPSLVSALGEQPALGIPFLAFIAVGTWFAYLVLAVLPTVMAPEQA